MSVLSDERFSMHFLAGKDIYFQEYLFKDIFPWDIH